MGKPSIPGCGVDFSVNIQCFFNFLFLLELAGYTLQFLWKILFAKFHADDFEQKNRPLFILTQTMKYLKLHVIWERCYFSRIGSDSPPRKNSLLMLNVLVCSWNVWMCSKKLFCFWFQVWDLWISWKVKFHFFRSIKVENQNFFSLSYTP